MAAVALAAVVVVAGVVVVVLVVVVVVGVVVVVVVGVVAGVVVVIVMVAVVAVVVAAEEEGGGGGGEAAAAAAEEEDGKRGGDDVDDVVGSGMVGRLEHAAQRKACESSSYFLARAKFTRFDNAELRFNSPAHSSLIALCCSLPRASAVGRVPSLRVRSKMVYTRDSKSSAAPDTTASSSCKHDRTL
jgi:hypothetical protein